MFCGKFDQVYNLICVGEHGHMHVGWCLYLCMHVAREKRAFREKLTASLSQENARELEGNVWARAGSNTLLVSINVTAAGSAE